MATHSSTQTLYINGKGLLKRHDYDVEIAGGMPGAHYIEGYEDVSGIMFPTKRRIFPRQADGTASPEPLVVSIALSDITPEIAMGVVSVSFVRSRMSAYGTKRTFAVGGSMSATGPKADIARVPIRALQFTLHCATRTWCNLSLLAGMRSLF
jgi:hypothetical protein